jgi:hypothetical protein
MRRDAQPRPARPEPPPTGKYRIDLTSVLDALSEDYSEDPVGFDGFEAARDHSVEALEHWIVVLARLVEELKRSERFADLDLGWYDPLITPVDGAGAEPEDRQARTRHPAHVPTVDGPARSAQTRLVLATSGHVVVAPLCSPSPRCRSTARCPARAEVGDVRS